MLPSHDILLYYKGSTIALLIHSLDPYSVA